MDINTMPANTSYTILVHAGSFKDFNKKLLADFPHLKIQSVKNRAVHYYIVHLMEDGVIEYKKENIYKLPIMAFREEFSNYLFFKNVKGYNNVLRLMCNGKENENAPYDLFQEMLTGFEKYRYANISEKTKEINYTLKEITTSVFGKNIMEVKVMNDIFECNKIKVEQKEIDFSDIVKKQHLLVGIL